MSLSFVTWRTPRMIRAAGRVHGYLRWRHAETRRFGGPRPGPGPRPRPRSMCRGGRRTAGGQVPRLGRRPRPVGDRRSRPLGGGVRDGGAGARRGMRPAGPRPSAPPGGAGGRRGEQLPRLHRLVRGPSRHAGRRSGRWRRRGSPPGWGRRCSPAVRWPWPSTTCVGRPVVRSPTSTRSVRRPTAGGLRLARGRRAPPAGRSRRCSSRTGRSSRRQALIRPPER